MPITALRALKNAGYGFRTIVDVVLPPRCLVTGEIVDGQGMVTPQVWRDLRFIGEPACVCCGIPFEFEVEKGARCIDCLSSPPPFKSARTPLIYDDLSREMILKFKHADQTHAVYAFLPWLRRAGAEMLAQADMIVPVPLHRFRLLQRRYNQAALIGQALGRACGLSCEPLVLQRCKATASQGHLSYKERQKNVRGAFQLTPRYQDVVKDKIIVLVDDVYTTGATVRECSKALLRAGAKEVHVLAVARVVHDGF